MNDISNTLMNIYQQLGLIDQVGGLSDGLQSLYRQIGEHKEKKT